MNAQLENANRRVKYAWARYYAVINADLHEANVNHVVYVRMADDREIPEHVKTELRAMASALKKKWECPVCTEMIEDDHLEITNCGHYYCKPCLATWQQTEKDKGKQDWKCCSCNRTHKFK